MRIVMNIELHYEKEGMLQFREKVRSFRKHVQRLQASGALPRGDVSVRAILQPIVEEYRAKQAVMAEVTGPAVHVGSASRPGTLPPLPNERPALDTRIL